MAKNGVTIVSSRFDLVSTSLKRLASRQVLVGIPADTTKRTNLEIDPSRGDISNAAIGYINEFGDANLRIPKRPHLVPGVRAAFPDIRRLFGIAAKRAAAGDDKGTTQALHATGLIVVASVKDNINFGSHLRLSEATMRWRRWHKRNNPNAIITDKPLIETGDYLAAIKYVVRARTP